MMKGFEATLGGAARHFPDTTMGMASRMRDRKLIGPCSVIRVP